MTPDGEPGDVSDVARATREQVAVDLEAEAAEYENQYGAAGLGGHAAAVFAQAAQIARNGRERS